MRWQLALSGIAAVLSGFGLAPPARAQPAPVQPPFTLTWVAPPGCPSGASIEAAVTALLGDARIASDGRVEARATATTRGARWTVTIETRRGDSRGTRELEASTCRELGDAVALTLALAIDPAKAAVAPPAVAALSSMPPSPPPPPASASPSTPLPPPPPAPAPPLRSRPERRAGPPVRGVAAPTPSSPGPSRNLEIILGAALAADAGVLPTPRFGPAVSFGVLARHLRGDVTATYLLRSSSGQTATGSSTEPERGEARFWLLSGRLRGCYVWTPVVELGLCVAGEVGMVHGSTLVRSSSEVAAWASAGLGGAFGWRFHRRLALWVPVLAEVGLARPKLTIHGTASEAHRPAIVTGRAEIGMEVRF